MNKPIKPKKIDYYRTSITLMGTTLLVPTTEYCDAMDKYYVELEKYCDKLEKALDKACDYLEAYTHDDQFPMCRYKDQWKEWLMKDER